VKCGAFPSSFYILAKRASVVDRWIWRCNNIAAGPPGRWPLVSLRQAETRNAFVPIRGIGGPQTLQQALPWLARDCWLVMMSDNITRVIRHDRNKTLRRAPTYTQKKPSRRAPTYREHNCVLRKCIDMLSVEPHGSASCTSDWLGSHEHAAYSFSGHHCALCLARAPTHTPTPCFPLVPELNQGASHA
jgi:hypothetical protein